MSFAKKFAYECYHNDLRSIQEDYDYGRITNEEYLQYLKNIEHNLNVDLEEIERE